MPTFSIILPDEVLPTFKKLRDKSTNLENVFLLFALRNQNNVLDSQPKSSNDDLRNNVSNSMDTYDGSDIAEEDSTLISLINQYKGMSEDMLISLFGLNNNDVKLFNFMMAFTPRLELLSMNNGNLTIAINRN